MTRKNKYMNKRFIKKKIYSDLFLVGLTFIWSYFFFERKQVTVANASPGFRNQTFFLTIGQEKVYTSP